MKFKKITQKEFLAKVKELQEKASKGGIKNEKS